MTSPGTSHNCYRIGISQILCLLVACSVYPTNVDHTSLYTWYSLSNSKTPHTSILEV